MKRWLQHLLIRHRWLLLGSLMLLSACGNSAQVTRTAVSTTVVALASTPTASPTTAAPSPTTVPTATLVPTALPTPTTPPAPTATEVVPTATPSPSPEPPTTLPSPTAEPTPTAEPPTAAPSPTTVAPSPTTAPATPTSAPALPTGTTSEGVAIRPDLAGKILFQRGDDLYLYRPRTGATQLAVQGSRVARFSPDGTRLAFARGNQLLLAQADGSDPQLLTEAANINEIRWAPDGSRLLFVSGTNPAGGGTISVVELADGSVLAIAEGADPAWAPDSKRITHVTIPPSEFPRRTQLRLISWQGKNGWSPVLGLPADVPAVGIPSDPIQPENFEHVLHAPFWDAEGRAIYFVGIVGMQAETDFGLWERADPVNGGAVFLNELTNVFEVVPAPNRAAAALINTTARGDSYFTLQPVNAQGDAYRWIEDAAGRQEGFFDAHPAWAPDSQALVLFRCSLDPQAPCDLQVRTPGGIGTLIPDVAGSPGFGSAVLDWAID